MKVRKDVLWTVMGCGLIYGASSPLAAQLRPRPIAPTHSQSTLTIEDLFYPSADRSFDALAPGIGGWNDAAAHIIGQQCLDGGWGWPHASCTTTYHNITGPITLGLLKAYGRTGDAGHLAAAGSAGDFDLLSVYPDINEVQTIIFPGTASGTITLSFNGDGPSVALTPLVSVAADYETALEGLSTISDVTVTEVLVPPGSMEVVFNGALTKNTDVPLITVDNSLNTGDDVTVTEQSAGGGGAESRFGTFTPHFMVRLADLSADPTYQSFAETQFFDELTAGSYGPDDLDTAGFINAVQTGGARDSTWINLRPWEFHRLITTAEDIGNPGQANLFRQALLDGFDTLDNTNPGAVYSDIIGLAGGVHGLALDQTYSFAPISSPNHALIDGVSSLCVLSNVLAGLQNADGSWYWHSNLGGPTITDEDAQTTAYAVMALVEAQRAGCGPYPTEIGAGRDWLWSMQDVDGGFLSYPTGTHNTEVEGEVLEALIYRLGDVDGNEFINVFDLISVLGAWGTCGVCLEDFNGDGEVNVTDLLVVLANWGF